MTPNDPTPTEADIERAKVRAKEYSSLIAAMLLAFVAWDEVTRRYKSVSDARVLSELEKVRQGYEVRVRSLAERLNSKTITLDDWALEMKTELKSLYALNAAIANGGLQHMSPADWSYVEEVSQPQYEFLQRFASQIQTGVQPRNGVIARRALMYVGASHVIYTEMQKRLNRNAGIKLAIRVLGAKESCEGCIREAAKDYQPIDKVAAIGSQECVVNCRCSLLFKKAA